MFGPSEKLMPSRLRKVIRVAKWTGLVLVLPVVAVDVASVWWMIASANGSKAPARDSYVSWLNGRWVFRRDY
jgi:hypothetical protein